MFWFLFGVLLVLCVRNQFDMQGVGKDLQKIAGDIRKIARDLARMIRRAVKDAKKETRKAGPEQGRPAAEAREEQPAQAEALRTVEAEAELQKAPRAAEVEAELPKAPEPEEIARAAVLLAGVPTLAFPEDDPKYDSSRKYRYA